MGAHEKPQLTVDLLCAAAAPFAKAESTFDEPGLYGVTDGKAVGTYLERKFVEHLRAHYTFEEGNLASGIDLPGINVDIKATSVRRPQSSCPFKSARQKIYGLGYHLLIFVYEKSDNQETQTGRLNIAHTVFIDKSRTADFQTTSGLRQITENDGNQEDIAAFLLDRNLPIDDTGANQLAQEILSDTPLQGYLTISNALQWRLQYGRAIAQEGAVEGIVRIY